MDHLTPEDIQNLRIEHNLQQKELAAMLYTTIRNVQYYEAGKRVMPMHMCELLLVRLGKMEARPISGFKSSTPDHGPRVRKKK